MGKYSTAMEPKKKKLYWKVPAEILGLYLVLALIAFCGFVALDGSIHTNLRALAASGAVIAAIGAFLYIFYDICGRLPFSNCFKRCKLKPKKPSVTISH